MLALLTIGCNPVTPTSETPSITLYAIIGINVVDVEQRRLIPEQTVIISGDMIQEIGPANELTVPVGAIVIDGRGRYLIPGLTDAHVHYFDAEVFGRVMLANGVLLARDLGMPNDYILPVRDQLNKGEAIGPELRTTGLMLDGVPPIIPSIALGIQTPTEGRTTVDAQVAAGVNMIKVYSRLDKEVFLAIVDEAHQHGLKVVAHLPETIYLEEAVTAGVDSLEHFSGFEKVIAQLLGEPVSLTFQGQGAQAGYLARLNEVDPAALQAFYQRLHASGVTVCPTIVTFKTLTNIKRFQNDDFAGHEYVSPGVRALWQSLWATQSDLPDFIWQNWAQMVRGLNEAGVPLLVGTDLMVPGILPGYALHEEMAIWQDAGLPPADILRSATLAPAQFMGLEHRLGTVAEGKTASLVVLTANPLDDIHNAQQIEAIFVRGQYYNRAALDKLLTEAADLAQP